MSADDTRALLDAAAQKHPDTCSCHNCARQLRAQVATLTRELAHTEDLLAGTARSTDHWERRAESLEAVLAAAREVSALHDQGEVAASLLEALANAVSVADGEDE